MTKPIKFIMISLASSMILLPTVLPAATIYGQEMMQDTSVIHQSLMPQFKVHLQVDEFQGQDQSQIDYDIIDQDQQEVVYSYRWNDGQTANEPIQLPEGRYLFRLYDGGQFIRQGQKVIPYQVQWLDGRHEAQRHQASHSGELATLNDGSLVYDFAFEIRESIPAEDQPSQYDIYLVGESVTNPIVPEIEPKGLEEEDGLEEGDQVQVGNEADQTLEEETSSLASDQGEANEVSSTSEAEPVTLQADQSGIQLIVKDSQGQPVKDVEVYVGYELLKTDDQGKAQLMNLAPMTYQVTLGILPEAYQNAVLDPTEVNLQANQITELTLELEGSQEETATTPEPVTSQETSEVTSQETSEEPVTSETTTTTEEATGSLDFIIQDDQQTAVAGVRVQVIDDQGQAQEVTTDAQGRGRIEQLRLGTYHYQILEVPQNYTAKDDLMSVQVLANEVNQQWITIQSQDPTASLNLQVEDQDGQGIEGVTLNVTDPAGETVQETTDAQGRVSFADLPAGDYTYEVVDLEDDYQGTRTGQVSLTPGQSQTQDLTFQAPNPVGDLTFQLMTEDGQGIEGVTLKVTDPAGEMAQETTDAQGQVTFADLPSGDYTYEVVDLESDYQGTRTGQISLASGQSQSQDLTFQAPNPVGDLTLQLVTEDGQGIEGAVLEVNQEEVMTQADGLAKIKDLPVGTYPVRIKSLPTGYEWQDQDLEVTLQADEETIFQIQVAERTTTQSTTTTAEPTTTTQSTTTTAEPTTTTQSTTTTAEPTTTTQSTTTTAEPTTTTQSTTSEPTTTTQTSNDQPTITIQSTTTEPPAPKPSLDHSVKDRDSKGVLYITQSDAKKVKKVTIQKVDLKPEDRPQALQGKDLDLYQVAPQDQAGNLVELADGSEVQLPIRSVNSQIQVLKVNGNQVENLPVTVNKQVATVKNNAQPGQLAVVYGNDPSQTNQTTEATSTTSQENKSSVVVKKSTDQRKAEDKQSGLPLTGERTSSIWLVLAGVFLLGGSYLVIKKGR